VLREATAGVVAGTAGRESEAPACGGRLPRRAVLLLAALVVAFLAFAPRAEVFVYWANNGGDTIGRAKLDGTGVNPNFITGAGTPVGVTVDDAHVYWASGETGAHGGSRGRANLDGTGVNQSFIPDTTVNFGSGVAVDRTHIYWTSAGSQAPSNGFSFGNVKKNNRKGTAKLTLEVPGSGELDLAQDKEGEGG
jgi:hypothetical protein